MKKIVLLSFLLCHIISGFSQSKNYKPFKIDAGLGYAIQTGTGGVKGGVTFTIEPHYRITDNIAVGIRFEGAELSYYVIEAQAFPTSISSLITSYCASGEYYFTKIISDLSQELVLDCLRR